MDVQNKFEWTYGPKKRVMRAIKFPKFLKTQEGKETRHVGGIVIKAILQAIEDHASPWSTCSPETLADEANCSLSQAKRALRILDREGLIINCSEAGKRSKHRPCWDTLLYCEFSQLTDSQRTEIEIELTKNESKQVPNRDQVTPNQQSTWSLDNRNLVPENCNLVPDDQEPSPCTGPRSIDTDIKSRYKIDNRYVDLNFDFCFELIDRATSVFEFKSGEDWNLFAKLAYMVALGQIPEDWFADALHMAKRYNGGIGYFVNEVKKKLEPGQTIGALLSNVWLPVELEFQGVK